MALLGRSAWSGGEASAGALHLDWGALEEGQCYELSSMKVNRNESGTTIGEQKAVVGECPKDMLWVRIGSDYKKISTYYTLRDAQ